MTSPLPHYPDLKKRTVIITGGANGIGEAMVETFAAQEAEVYFCDVDLEAGHQLAAKIGRHTHFSKVDLRREVQVIRWVEKVAAASPDGIDVLINNAARDPRIPLDQITMAEWDDLFALNLRAMALTCREVAPRMNPKRGGSIINFSSVTFHIAPTEMSAYVATKAGIVGLTRTLSRELGPRNIRVNAISPGWVMTERQLKQYVTPAVKRFLRKTQCIPYLIQPSDMAQVALFLSSQTASRAITGQEILADLGQAFS